MKSNNFNLLTLVFVQLYISCFTPTSSANQEDIYCNGVENDITSFNCSNMNIFLFTQIKNMEIITSSHKLILSQNKLTQLPAFSFYKFVSLTHVYLSSNMIKKIDEFAFYTNVSVPMIVEHLDLKENQLETLPWSALVKLNKLKTLHLGQNPIKLLDYGDLASNRENQLSIEELYLNGCEIEIIDPNVLRLFESLRILDLSSNKIRYVDGSLGSLIESRFAASFQHIHLYNNPLECTCHLVWLKEFFKRLNYKQSTQCRMKEQFNAKGEEIGAGNTKMEHYTIDNFKQVKHEDISLTQVNEKNGTTNETINSPYVTKSVNRMLDLVTESFYCDLKSSSSILIDKPSRTIQLTCEIESYPHADIKWLLGEGDLEKLHTNKDNQLRKIQMHRHADTNKTSQLYTLKSTVQLEYYRDEQLLKENFTCKAFLQNKIVHNVLFELNSKDKSAVFEYFNKKMSVKKDGDRYMRQVPFIYWIILAICLLFSVTVIIFAAVCIVRSNRAYRRRKMEASKANGDYYYDSINKRSAIYMRSQNPNDKTITTLKQPLKPIVIRDHQDYSSIYSDNNNSTSNPNNSSLSTTLTSTAPYGEPPSRHSRLSNSRTNTAQRKTPNTPRKPNGRNETSFDNDPADVSFPSPRAADPFDDTSSSTNSSKLFEEDFEQYQDPKFDDLRKPSTGQNSRMV